VNFTRFPQCIRPTCVLDFAVHYPRKPSAGNGGHAFLHTESAVDSTQQID